MSRTTIVFLGQCHTYGYPGVPPEAAFPQVLRRAIEAYKPDTTLNVILEPYDHPSGLSRSVTRALRHRPRIVVVEVTGWLAVKGSGAVNLSRLPKTFHSTYDRVRHFRVASQFIAAKIPQGSKLIYRFQSKSFEAIASVLGPLIARYPRPTVEEYRACVSDAIQRIVQSPGTQVVIQGPGSPNLDLNFRGLAADAVERYKAVECMAREVATQHGTMYVDRWNAVNPDFFSPGSIRPTAEGHMEWGNLLARELLSNDVF